MIEPDSFALLAELLCQRCFFGWTPIPDRLLDAVVQTMPEIFLDVDKQAIEVFFDRLRSALEVRHASGATEYARWIH